MNKQTKQLTELSDEELKQVTGGGIGGAESIVMVKKSCCNLSLEGCPVGEIYTYVDGKCQCVPVPNTERRAR